MSTPENLRVLVVDDDPFTRHLLQAELVRMGHQVVGQAADGQQGVTLAQALHPDVILMDIMMPVLDGLEATRQVQEQCPSPVVLLTAHETPDLVRQGAAAGAAAYLVKAPVVGELARALSIAVARHADLMELRRLNAELQAALAKVKLLSGLLPICSGCKKIRDTQGYWQQVESYIREHSEAEFSHGLCPDCARRLYPEVGEMRP